MLTRSELRAHRNSTLNIRIPLSCSRCDLNSWIPLFRSTCELIVLRQKNNNKSKREQIVTKREFTRHREACDENVRDSAQMWTLHETSNNDA